MTSPAREDGVALLVAILAMLLMTALGTAVMLTSSSDTIIAAHFRDNLETRYAAALMIERGMDDIAVAADWTLLTGGALPSSWTDGVASGTRTLADGSTLDVAQMVNMANCRKAAVCSTAEMSAVSADRPWGANNPQWKPYAYGPLRDLMGTGSIDSPCYVMVLVGSGIGQPGWDVVAVRAEAFGPRGAHAVVEATAGRATRGGGARILSWREMR